MKKTIPLGTKIFFESSWDDFSAYRLAEKWCTDNWYSYGSMARDMRIWICKWKDICIAKWYNLGSEDIKQLDWYIYCEWWYRTGKIWIVIFDTPKE